MDRLKKMLVNRPNTPKRAFSLSSNSGPPPYSSMEAVNILDPALVMPSAPQVADRPDTKVVKIWVEASLKVRTDKKMARCSDIGALVSRLVDKYDAAIGYKPIVLSVASVMVVLIEAVSEDPGTYIYKTTFSHPIQFYLRSPYNYTNSDVEVVKSFKSMARGATAYVDFSLTITPTEIKATDFGEVIKMAQHGAAQSSTTVHQLMDLMGVEYEEGDVTTLICK
ncbi:MAG: matrix protein [Frankliniella intonsa rhabdovirus 1]|uniref:Matrix protein n=1 Tax=Frankliniella intonsa rhabdovirus 1 TaxID=3070917 RepID=A0A8K1XB94_9RHAB|nr:MAG: matrix protein [Frankliniella intonsa rhabdovirus 1]UHK03324.1 MAG: matrix protein [Frankliniella intonsa rhabdovirus 1]